MTQIRKPKLGKYIAGMSMVAVFAIATFIALPKMFSPEATSAAALLKFDNPYGAAVEHADVDRQWMVYVDYRGNEANLYTYNFSNNKERMITWDVSVIDESITRPQIQDGYVAYNNRLEDGTYVMNHFDPYMYKTKVVGNSKQKMSAPAFDNSIIVWTQEDPEYAGAQQIYFADVKRTVTEKLTNSAVARRSATVRNNVVYWLEANGDNWDLVSHDLDHSHKKVLVKNKPFVGNISASGNRIAYALQGASQTDVYTLNTVTKKVDNITNSGVDERNPIIFGDRVAYDEYVGLKDKEVALYDFSTGLKTVLTNDNMAHGSVSLTDSRLVWADAHTGISQIYLYDFKSSENNVHFSLSKKIVSNVVEPQPTAPAVPEITVLNVDTDGDGLTDEQELNFYGTKPKTFDSDGDGLNDYDEVKVYFTHPLKYDTDGDGYFDGVEVRTGHSPLVHADKATTYGVERFYPDVEHAKAVQLKNALEAKLGKGKIGIHRDAWPFYAMAYIYGGYSVDEIAKSSQGAYGVISAEVSASDWRQTQMYKNGINK